MELQKVVLVVNHDIRILEVSEYHWHRTDLFVCGLVSGIKEQPIRGDGTLRYRNHRSIPKFAPAKWSTPETFITGQPSWFFYH